MTLRAGRISYTNDLPIYHAFDEGAVAFPGALTSDVPTALNAALLAGALDMSPVSAHFFAQHADELALLPDLCIGSRDQVWSVILVSPRPPQELDGAEIALTPESASGRALLRAILERRFGVRPRYVEGADPFAYAVAGKPALLIGDRAIEVQRSVVPEHVYDLGSLWHAWTAADMVYAVWAVRRDVLRARGAEVAAAMDALRASRAWGVVHADSVIAAAQALRPRGEGFYAAYYRTLNFAFDEHARAGLARFVAESVAVGTLERPCSVEPVVFDVAR
jgi:chorismate dehydratase